MLKLNVWEKNHVKHLSTGVCIATATVWPYDMFCVCICCDCVHAHPYTWGVYMGLGRHTHHPPMWVGVTGVVVTGLFIGYLPSDWLGDRPQVHFDQLDLLSGSTGVLTVTPCDKKSNIIDLKNNKIKTEKNMSALNGCLCVHKGKRKGMQPFEICKPM